MTAKTVLKAALGLGSVLVTVGADSDLLPDCKLKHILVTAGVLGGMLTTLCSKIPTLRPAALSPTPPGLLPASALEPGDVLLYSATGIYGRVIERKTWHRLAHVEIFVGNGESVASRDGLGTGRYPLRQTELAVVCRPRVPFDLAAGLRWFVATPHRPYGWLDLLQFVGFDVDTGGIVCSPFATEFERATSIDPFNGEPAAKIAPFEFLLSNCYDTFLVTPDGTLARHGAAEVAHA